MFFAPNFKSKRGGSWNIQPFPPNCVAEGQENYNGIFTGISVEVCNECDIRALYSNGFYGKGSHSRSIPNALLQNESEDKKKIEESLSLGLEESFFLSYFLNVLKITDLNNEAMNWKDFIRYAQEVNVDFIESLASYLYLKSKGWVVKSGLKFAGNYLIYRKGPRFFHASFVVIVNALPNSSHLQHNKLKGLQRIAETSDKDVLVLDVSKPADFHMQTVNDITQISIAETVIKRFNYTSFVQQSQQRNVQ
ncbi:tRNA-splicing endonuclease subunit Sen2 [Stomoxys calcitrans]|uniref:tRNA-splicing endonuclease subunit Sen2 n=1 Tax=Stomoxys calcitrans TaxID=35570 RepID=UPI0027E289F3|nr:tRNA-splicing endonuclease subunit Sen2 [Stomoxys calcitrans]